MNRDFIKNREKELLAQKKKLETELKKIAKKDKKKEDYHAFFPEYGFKEDENAAEITEYQENLSLEKNLENLLSNINKSLAKIKKGTYGICEKCGQEIDKSRLEVFPAANLCLNCKSREESRSRY